MTTGAHKRRGRALPEQLERAPTTLEVIDMRCAIGFLHGDDTPRVVLELVVLEDPADPSSRITFPFLLTLGRADNLGSGLLGVVEGGLHAMQQQGGLDALAMRRARRDLERRRRTARNQVRDELQSLTIDNRALCSADGCRRMATISADGVDYCKRHADAAGVCPRGKIT